MQDVDKWDADVAALLPAFGFLPRWRIDDIMVSFAATGGSVGAHVDQYDVFLLQAHGHRRWQVDASEAMGRKAPGIAFRDDVELKLLQRLPSDARLDPRARRHALPAARRAAPRRRRGSVPDLLGRHARAVHG